MAFWKNERVTPAQVIILGFLLLILGGAGLLMLPIATRGPGGASFADALFTATSATCVTGLVIHDTVTYWSEFGQLVILLLIQAGGMGVVTMAIAVAMFTGKRIGLRQRCLMQEAIGAPQVGGIVRMTGFILRATLVMEAAGAILLALRFCPEYGLARGIWYGVFHSVSAFCNAGFDLMGAQGPYSSLTGFAGDGVVSLTVAGLIVAGGIGFFTWDDLCRHRWHFRSYRLQTKLILTTTACLVALPALFLYFGEFAQPQWAGLTGRERVLAALFQAVTPRTAGFNTVDLTALGSSSRLLMILLMLVGGAPGSTAGGFKTTTLATFVLSIRAVLGRRESIQCFGRRLPPEILRSAVSICALYVALFLTGGMLLSAFDGVPLSSALFETASAIGTVGLSLGVTPGLGAESRLVLVALMYFGRVGGLTMMYALVANHAPTPAQMPLEKIAVG